MPFLENPISRKELTCGIVGNSCYHMYIMPFLCKMKSHMVLEIFPPHHLVDDAHIALDNLHYLGAYVLIHIIRHRDAMLTVLAKLYCSIYRLQEALLVNTGNDEVAFVDGFGPFRTGSDADGREGMSDAGEEAALLGQGATIAHDGKGIHLKTVVVVEA